MSLPSFLQSGELARLMPVAADSGKEARAASMLLAVLTAVPVFRTTMLGTVQQRVGVRARLDCFTEVVFHNEPTEIKSRPDGLLILESGKGRTWSCLLEAKIGLAQLAPDQIERYAALAKRNGIDSILTVSNQFATLPTHSPVRMSTSALKGVTLYHWSWMFVLTQTQLLLSESAFEESAQRYILQEFSRHLEHPSVGVSKFDRMNPEWKELVGKVQTGAVLTKNDPAVEASIASWHQEVRDLCLLLSRKLRTLVTITLSRAQREDPELRLRSDCETLLREHKMECTLVVPDAAAPIDVTADLLRRSLNVSMTFTAPKDKQRASARISWMLRQLSKSTAPGIQVRALWPGRAPDTQAPLETLRENPELLESDNKTLAPQAFQVILVRDLAGKFAGTKTFIEQVEDAVPLFYQDIGEYVRAYVPPPPRIVSKEPANPRSGDTETPAAPERTANPLPDAADEMDRDGPAVVSLDLTTTPEGKDPHPSAESTAPNPPSPTLNEVEKPKGLQEENLTNSPLPIPEEK